MNYQKTNSEIIDSWCRGGWEWGQPVTHEVYENAANGKWDVLLTPTKPVPHEWFGELKGKRLLGLASGGGQQMPVFSALGADCVLMDFSSEQCAKDREVSAREGYDIEIIQADMTKRFPFPDESFDIIFHPVSNCYVEKVEPVFAECFRVLKNGGILLGGYSLYIDFAFDEKEERLKYKLPYNPLRDRKLYKEAMEYDYGIQFSHTLEEQLGGQLKAGFRITDLYDDVNLDGNIAAHNIPSYVAVRSVKQI